MAVISKDLGAVTAYAAAVNRGYTGTKEEFETLMASYATVAQQAAQSAQSASSSAQGAFQAASSANNAMNNARTAESNAQSAASGAQGYAQSAQQSAQSASQSATDAESAKDTAIDAVDGFAAGAQQALDGVNQAGVNWKSLAQAHALDSEAWAVGTRDGEDVGAQDETYHNNAKYYAESVSTSAQTATEAAQTATQKAGEAAQSASAAAESARTLTIDATLTQSGQAADAKAVGDEIDSLKSAYNYLENVTTDINYGANLLDVVNIPSENTNKVVNWANGELASANGYVVSDYIPVRAGIMYGFSGTYQFFAFYNKNKSFVSQTESNDIRELSGGSGTTTKDTVGVVWFVSPINGFIRYSIRDYLITGNHTIFAPISTSADIIATTFPAYTNGYDIVNSAEKGIGAVDEKIDNLAINISGDKNALVYKFDLAASSIYVQTVYIEDMCNFRISFFGKISNGLNGTLVIGKGVDLDMGGSIRLDNTKVSYWFGGGSSAAREQEHGIEEFKDYIGVTIDAAIGSTAKVYIYTNGGSYTWNIPFFRAWREKLTVYSSQTAFEDCTLSYTCAGLLTDTWLYGDSYFSTYDTNRWTSYLVSNGYKNFHLNAYPGRNSVQALRSLKVDLEIYKYPKRIIWCLGMNDPDANSQPNANWLEIITELKQICTDHCIELILAKIPLVPDATYINNYKNAYVENESGCRYIDFSNAVNNGDGSNWYDNMLYTNETHTIHPIVQGAIALYNQAVSDVPELLA